MNLPSRAALLVLCWFSVFSAAFAEIDIDLDGRPVEVGSIPTTYSPTRLRPPMICGTTVPGAEEAILEYERSIPAKPTVAQLRTFASNLAMFGRHQKAIELFLRVEELQPGIPDLPEELARCFQDMERPTSALIWSKKALERKGPHLPSSWLRVRILEAELRLSGDPHWLGKRSALGLDFGNDPRPRFDPNLPKEIYPDEASLATALGWQVIIRRSPGALEADMLFDLGNALALRGAVQTAVGVYELAQEYKAPRAALLKERLAYARRLVAEAEKKGTLQKRGAASQ